jgi:Mrp family chromosome partitioning ATPase
LVGHVPSTALGKMRGQNGNRPPEEAFEAFRILKRNSEFLDPRKAQKTIAITSALAEEGKSTVAAGLAAANAIAGKQVLLVEGDLRRPVLAERFGISERPGLTDYLEGASEAEQIPQVIDLQAPGWPKLKPMADKPGGKANNGPAARLTCITAGSPTDWPGELLASEHFAAFVKKVRQSYDLVVFDSAPLLPVGDTLEMLPRMDGIIICVRLAQTTRDHGSAVRTALERLPDRPTGVVVTGITPSHREGYYGYEYVSVSRG